ncbi:N-acetyl-gamma-glutamyl-phosphate reductase [Alkalihalobacillus alcalophilus ATCC 27647 = CGMCC 1.3604]|uniref:N-acetyl-gamma-glutamyl-phosphate reductase n=1 Tax=Alkalihalobacillus alcalophilus ATCC 27647 = CGMCC 1.3604 TaxID=1218173 RepID=A0A094WKK1_ALKAL|nr:N-acetyl-gamma-glutamyl-phosphate reductase [Alkalihalobacillus alcalophilus]KGA97381.1 N-acetyl-gamma-glutamyl-phosphate reductase [Alkalihalobacillus alcalophilus ATCC 27647 = CGMCC 1.3604]MED1560548.1 N-acetyl-gamma-glutamyl-phosphate reductase [Alkalihalobacillus alcalophilus]THG89159.1 N-acetyl-gamma-glutamyl-phosphate reductase [Alkalihalobacillus alcalophilus ATCC 27647 = CGMCC 1.3604]
MKIGIVGATGYGGADLLRLLHQHPKVNEIILYSSSQEGVHIHESYPHLSTIYEQSLNEINVEKIAKQVDIVFLATPPGVSAELSEPLVNLGVQVIDLSGDLRIKDTEIYQSWYKRESASQSIIDQAVYGLPEWNKEAIEKAKVVANPGCYPTATLLGLAPLIKANLIELDSIIVDAKSGTSGAGRSPSAITHFSEMNENFKAYQINKHKHTPEIEQILQQWDEGVEVITFQPHLVPMVRGIMATIYAKAKAPITESDLRKLYEENYQQAPFVRVRPEGAFPATKEVYGSNFCDIGVTYDKRTGRITVVSVIDNVVKGASGQAIQNLNIMNGWEEQTGLAFVPVYP